MIVAVRARSTRLPHRTRGTAVLQCRSLRRTQTAWRRGRRGRTRTLCTAESSRSGRRRPWRDGERKKRPRPLSVLQSSNDARSRRSSVVRLASRTAPPLPYALRMWITDVCIISIRLAGHAGLSLDCVMHAREAGQTDILYAWTAAVCLAEVDKVCMTVKSNLSENVIVHYSYYLCEIYKSNLKTIALTQSNGLCKNAQFYFVIKIENTFI
jgi:hypothetical protein